MGSNELVQDPQKLLQFLLTAVFQVLSHAGAQVLVDQLREQCGSCDKEGEKDKPLQRVEEEALQREPQDIVEYLREQGVCLRQLARKLEQNETLFL